MQDRVIALWTTDCLKAQAIKFLHRTALLGKHFERPKEELHSYCSGARAIRIFLKGR